MSSLAACLGTAALWDDWRSWQAEHRAAMAVSADEIRRVVATYLIDAGLTVGWSLPGPGAEPVAETVAPRHRLNPEGVLNRRPVSSSGQAANVEAMEHGHCSFSSN